MKTLIIHPRDTSTDFLKGIYFDLPNKTIISGGITKKEVHEQIKEHDRIVMLGHGAPSGLMSVGRFGKECFNIIDHTSVELLKQKTDNVYIWCNADQFVNKHSLKGFYSGMFVSEVSEAFYCKLPKVRQEQVDQSNYGFSHILSKHIHKDTREIFFNVKSEYGKYVNENPVVGYNHPRLYQRL